MKENEVFTVWLKDILWYLEDSVPQLPIPKKQPENNQIMHLLRFEKASFIYNKVYWIDDWIFEILVVLPCTYIGS